MIPVLPIKRILVGLLLLSLAWGFWGELRIASLKTEKANAETALQAEKRDRAEKLAHGIEQARKEDLATIQSQAQALKENHATLQSLRADVSRLRSATSGLRGDLERIKAAASAAAASVDPSASSASRTAAETVSVLADLLSRCSERRAELAQYADEARTAGELCVKSYRALIPLSGAP